MTTSSSQTNAVEAIVWKELRENHAWALLALVAIGICNAYSCYNARGMMQDDAWFLGIGMVSVTTPLLGPIAGAMMAAAQILPELRRDQWAFLLHRPITPTTLFAGKSAAGLLMVFLAIALPDLITCLWLRSRTPNPALFRWEILNATLLSLLGCLLYTSPSPRD